VNVVVVVYICATAGEGTSDVLCQHFDGGRPQASVSECMEVSVLVDVISLCWGRLTSPTKEVARSSFFLKQFIVNMI
jgi:hypothetical protein